MTIPYRSLALIAALLGPIAAHAQDVPARLQVGDSALTLASQATRERWFVDLYRVSLYAPTPTPTFESLRGAHSAKALRIEVLYGGDLPQSIPDQWKEELMPRLSQRQAGRLREAYAGLDEGDVVRVEYAPPVGSRILVNGKSVVDDRGEGPMHAFLDIFVGPDPVSDGLKQQLLD